MTWDSPPELVSYMEWHYLDIQGFVKNLYGQEWKGGAAMGFPSQDTYHDVDVDGGYIGVGIDNEGNEIYGRWLTEKHTHDQGEAVINKFKAEGMPREEYADPSLELLLNWLAFEGHIPTGKYRILVWW